jgi:anti-sigma-K factor RskA
MPHECRPFTAAGAAGKTMTERDDIHMLVAGRALGALGPGDEELLDRHLAVCDRCRSELASLEEAAAALATGVKPVAPPPELRERLLHQVRAESSNVIVLPRKRFAFRLAPVAAAAAACAALAIGIWAVSLSRSLDRERDARRAQERALAILAEPGSRPVALEGASGVLVRQPSGEAALIVSRLPKAPSGKSYEAWVMRGGVPPLRAGVFSGGGDVTVVTLERSVPAGSRVAVTRERKGGVNAPTGKPLFGAKVSSA